MTKKEIRIAIKAAKKWPPGYGNSWALTGAVSKMFLRIPDEVVWDTMDPDTDTLTLSNEMKTMMETRGDGVLL